MSFNMGSIPNNFVKFRKAIQKNDLKEMAIEILDSAYCDQVKTRCLKNCLLLLKDVSGTSALILASKI